MKANLTAAKMGTDRPIGKITIRANHPERGIKRGTIECQTIDELVTAFEDILDAGLAVDKDFTLRIIPGIPGTIARIQAAYRRKSA